MDKDGVLNAMNAALIDELPMAVECRLVSYNPESCRLVGEKVASAFKDGTKLK